jgi:hypothetical protein
MEAELTDKAPLLSDAPADENIVDAPDWTKIEAEYRAGTPLRAIAAQFGVGKSTISRKAESEGWQRSGTDPGQTAGQAQEKSGTTEAVPPVVPSSDDGRDFDWDDHDLVVLHKQPRTALYFNHHGDLVIRQQAFWDDEPFVFITEEYIESFVEKLIDLVGYPSGCKSP